MYAQVKKSKKNSFTMNRQDSRAVANTVGQEDGIRKQGYGFEDNRTKDPMIRILQKFPKNIKICQRHAYWPINRNNTVTNHQAQAAAPGGDYIKRVGGNQNHELHNGARKARNAARTAAQWRTPWSTIRNDTNTPQSQGVYNYNIDYRGVDGTYNLIANTNCVINHTHDPQAQLELHRGPNVTLQNTVNHFHAYRYNAGAFIRNPLSTAAQPNGNARLGCEHYFVNPF